MKESAAQAKTTVSGKERVRKHREALRASGLRPVTRWVPDLRKPEVLAEYQRQLAVIAADHRDRAMLAELEAIQADEGWV